MGSAASNDKERNISYSSLQNIRLEAFQMLKYRAVSVTTVSEAQKIICVTLMN
jgi:hypothetical protein